MNEPLDLSKKRPGPWDKRRKDMILRAFVWLICIPAFCFLSWYGVYKLAMWLMHG